MENNKFKFADKKFCDEYLDDIINKRLIGERVEQNDCKIDVLKRCIERFGTTESSLCDEQEKKQIEIVKRHNKTVSTVIKTVEKFVGEGDAMCVHTGQQFSTLGSIMNDRTIETIGRRPIVLITSTLSIFDNIMIIFDHNYFISYQSSRSRDFSTMYFDVLCADTNIMFDFVIHESGKASILDYDRYEKIDENDPIRVLMNQILNAFNNKEEN